MAIIKRLKPLSILSEYCLSDGKGLETSRQNGFHGETHFALIGEIVRSCNGAKAHPACDIDAVLCAAGTVAYEDAPAAGPADHDADMTIAGIKDEIAGDGLAP